MEDCKRCNKKQDLRGYCVESKGNCIRFESVILAAKCPNCDSRDTDSNINSSYIDCNACGVATKIKEEENDETNNL